MNTLSQRVLSTCVIAIAAAGAFFIPTQAQAGSANGTLSVTAAVAQKCTVSSPTLGFGSYDPVGTNLSADLDASTTITLTCTKGATGVTLGFGASPNAGT